MTPAPTLVAALLADQYGVQASALSDIQNYSFDWRGIYKVDVAPSISWVVRLINRPSAADAFANTAALLEYLAAHGYAAPHVQRTLSGALVGTASGWWLQALSYVPGTRTRSTPADLALIGGALARLHVVGEDGGPKTEDGRVTAAGGGPQTKEGRVTAADGGRRTEDGGITNYPANPAILSNNLVNPAILSLPPALPDSWWPPGHASTLRVELESYASRWPAVLHDVYAGLDAALNELTSTALPTSLIHGDCWPPNAVRRAGQATLIDWDCAGWGIPVTDLANLLLTCHYDLAQPLEVQPQPTWVAAALRGYTAVRPLKDAERNVFLSALRFPLAFAAVSYARTTATLDGGDLFLQKLQARYNATAEIAQLAQASYAVRLPARTAR